MASTAEYRLTVEQRRDEMESESLTVFRFATVREFRSFQYRIEVDHELDREARTITLRIGGVRAPSSLVPSSGTATTEIICRGLSGRYSVLVTGSRQSQSFTIDVGHGGVTVESVEEGGFVEIV